MGWRDRTVILDIQTQIANLVVAASELLIVGVSLGVWSPPEDGGADVVSHGDVFPAQLLSTISLLLSFN